jgi:hypothetical protein
MPPNNASHSLAPGQKLDPRMEGSEEMDDTNAGSPVLWNHDMANPVSDSSARMHHAISTLSGGNSERGASGLEYKSTICQGHDSRSESPAVPGTFVLSLAPQSEVSAPPGSFKPPFPLHHKPTHRKMSGMPRKAPHVQRHDTCMYCYTLHFKCDRAKPSCEGCSKRKTTCTYPTIADIKCTHCDDAKSVCMLYICPEFPGCTRCKRHGLNCSLAPRLPGDPTHPLPHDAFMDAENAFDGTSWQSKTGSRGTSSEVSDSRDEEADEDANVWPYRKGCRMEVLFDDGYWCLARLLRFLLHLSCIPSCPSCWIPRFLLANSCGIFFPR